MTASTASSNSSSLILACNIHNTDIERGCSFPCVVSLARRMQGDMPPGCMPWETVRKEHLKYILLLGDVTLFDILFDPIPRNCVIHL